eukprot:6205698-Prorocentrum_lima.AAC.1
MAPHAEYVDDFVLRISAASAADFHADFSAASAAALRAHSLVGLPVNVAPDKTAAILSLKGPGAAAVRNSLLTHDTPEAPPRLTLSAHGHLVPVVRRYVYLGSLLTDSSVSMKPEALHRSRLAKTGVFRARTRLTNSSFSLRSRLQL